MRGYGVSQDCAGPCAERSRALKCGRRVTVRRGGDRPEAGLSQQLTRVDGGKIRRPGHEGRQCGPHLVGQGKAMGQGKLGVSYYAMHPCTCARGRESSPSSPSRHAPELQH